MPILLLLISCLAYASPDIVGGEVVHDPTIEAPFFVKVGDDCGGSLIHEKFVLTAAHCVDEMKTVAVQDMFGTKVKSKIIILHPDFAPQKKGLAYDFALIELPSKLKATVIAIGTDTLKKGQLLTSYGFGNTSTTTYTAAKELMKLDEPFVPSAISNLPESYNGMITESMFTAGWEEGQRSTCQGDSGGPLVDQYRPGAPELFGVVSWGEGCAKPKKYSVYGKISHVLEWIWEYVPKKPISRNLFKLPNNKRKIYQGLDQNHQ